MSNTELLETSAINTFIIFYRKSVRVKTWVKNKSLENPISLQQNYIQNKHSIKVIAINIETIKLQLDTEVPKDLMKYF